MKAKDFFNAAARAQKRVRKLQDMLRHYSELATSTTSRITGMPGGAGPGSKVENAVVGMIDTEGKLREELAQAKKLVSTARAVITLVPVERYRRILDLKYLQGWTFVQVGEEIGYKDRNSVYRAHGYALREAQGVLDKASRKEV